MAHDHDPRRPALRPQGTLASALASAALTLLVSAARPRIERLRAFAVRWLHGYEEQQARARETSAQTAARHREDDAAWRDDLRRARERESSGD